ncbi:rab GTPase-activating protein 1-like, isoform 10-like isoform X2 [Anopheles sinensis]|uniref:Rab GTPase-activating protein 1-like, isoform 10-like isoform X2 n=1 Tax=Anopheles sinensis TaxID=74873 RepID=A0A084W6Q2_ANOSI|nr:rab GTPase-activating protein 1-like, isoform 10-like isoform X2 [Anopheles sinensis]
MSHHSEADVSDNPFRCVPATKRQQPPADLTARRTFFSAAHPHPAPPVSLQRDNLGFRKWKTVDTRDTGGVQKIMRRMLVTRCNN